MVPGHDIYKSLNITIFIGYNRAIIKNALLDFTGGIILVLLTDCSRDIIIFWTLEKYIINSLHLGVAWNTIFWKCNLAVTRSVRLFVGRPIGWLVSLS